VVDAEEQARKLLPEFHRLPRHMGEAVQCSICCALVVNSAGPRNHHARWHADLWRLMAGVQPFSEEETATLRTFFEEVDRG
jgi:hypothetical protein